MMKIQSRPQLSPEDALAAVRHHFGLDGTLTPLPGERDRNFLLEVADGSRYVVKASSPDEADAILQVEVDLMKHLVKATEGFAPDMISTTEGDFIAKHRDEEGREHRVRVVEYLEGGLLAHARPRSEALLRDLGRRVAQLSSALGAYPDHPPARIDFDWAMGRSGLVMERGLDLFSGEQLELVQAVHDAWTRREPDFLGLGSQVIHGDINDHNVLVSAAGDGPRRVTGIIDLGDAHSAPRVFDLGIAIAYAILGTPDPLIAAATIARGFHETTPLAVDEIDVLYSLARARLGASVSISAWRRQESVEVDEYLTVSEQPAWDMLRRLHDVPERLAEGLIRDACGLQACPRSAVLVKWLGNQKVEPVMAIPSEAEFVTVLDLSVGSAELNGRDTEDTEAFTRSVFRRIEDDGATVGVGRYLEPRAFYLTDTFRGRDGDPRERRTVHLGIDLFDQVGAEVHAPLKGRVRSVKDNGAEIDYGPTVVLEHDGPAGPFWTLYGHLERESVSGLEPNSVVEAGQQIARLGPFPENGDWPPHLHFQIVTNLLDFEGQFPGVALPRESSAWRSFCPDPNLILRLQHETTYHEEDEHLLERRRQSLAPNLSLSYSEPLHIVRGIETFLYDSMGRGYLDCVNNVAHVGHEHPKVVRAGKLQMGLLNTNTRYLHSTVIEYAERLARLLPDPLSVCLFVNSGSEANELALRIARAHTGGSGVVSIAGGYHGNTQGLVDVSHYKHAGPGGTGAPAWVAIAPTPDDYRGIYGREVMDRATRYAGHVREAFARLSQDHPPSAFVSEGILSCAGQIEPPAGYYEAAYRHARAAGALCIADEVQTGFGRVGSHMWGFEAHGVTPDIVTLGKPIGNGHPIGAVVTTPEIAASFANGMEFFSTFGGNPVSAAIGLAVLDVLVEGKLQEHAAVVGGTLKANLASLSMRHDSIGDVRGRGLFLGVEFVSSRSTKTPSAGIATYVANRARELGVLLSTDGPDHNVIKIKPPMTFSQQDAERLTSTLDRILVEDPVRAQLT